MYEAIKKELASGGRAYIICPLVGESTTKALADVKVGSPVLPPPSPDRLLLTSL